MKILIVEDDGLHLALLKKLVSKWGYRVKSVEEGWQAMELAVEEEFDLFMLDVFLPDMNAKDLIPMLKLLRPNPQIITLTGDGSPELEGQLRDLGSAYHMAKPFQNEELHSVLNHISEGRASGKTLFPQGRIGRC